ncbi:TetR/AcrR family transcriptional regulator [Blastococcus sp. CT_GayMR20]|uniref:TetR/AcrR family transcriptional regulator n=1 Tax=Blastococcus sp. CT_GayMR20 TaxID=2559609 RepID=UPI001073499F|nr:TetR/AcrR family transcriptional regulator [Blastococcus sp. CT_GayMR20]TFV81360.1 TetR/AcrR family transcriptional regulator [Blastococcus sp. CT_GayMR20]TFV81375.1 TetR/AcrR family transcriptional regulator [Blastococcus sp. CT_GayMR20]
MTAGKRVYRSPLREEQARQTRVAVLEAAGECFLDRGYAATTMRDIADAAGVSVQTVFGQGSKASLLLACVDRAVVGDDEAVALAAREPFVRFVEATDPAGKLAALADMARRYIPQAIPTIGDFARAAAVDREIAAAWEEYEQRRRRDARALIGSLGPWLRTGMDVETATDVFWGLFSNAPVEALMGRRGWSLERYVDFVVDSVERLLLDG